MATTQDAIETLHRENCSCVILKDNETSAFRGPGISDLLRILKTEPDKLKDAFVADKVIGKAAAALLILGEVEGVYADLISESAIKLLRRYHIEVTFAEQIAVILNRAKDDVCPMEKICSEQTEPKLCYERINEFIASKNNKPQ